MIPIADRLNPIVLKELRQGLKSRSFIATFIGLQGLMVLSMLIYLASVAGNSGDLDFPDALFWFMLGLMLILFMPLRAFQALHEEVKGNTIEMLFLTRMTAWDIAFGKWLALLTQVGLLVCAVLPYLVMRYFLGSVDVAGDLLLLFLEVIASSLLVAVGVGLSSWTSKLLRGLVILGALFSLNLLPVMLFGISSSGTGGAFAAWGLLEVVVWVVVAVMVMLLFVEYGASQIAPPAENHAVRKRLLALLLSVVLMVLGAVTNSGAPVLVGLCMLVPVAIDALCEPLVGIGSIYRSKRKWGPLRWLFYPGWASGFLFVLVIFCISLFAAWVLEDLEIEVIGAGLMGFNLVIFPFFLIRLFPVLGRKALLTYLVVQVASLLSLFLFLFLDEIGLVSNYDLAGQFVPILGFYVMLDHGVDELIPVLQIVPTTLFVVVGLLRARRPFLAMQRLSREPAA